MRDSLVFYRSFADAAKYLSDEDRLRFFDGLIAYALNDQDPDFDGPAAGMFLLIKPQIDANNRKYENGKRGGRPSNESIQGFENQNETKTKPNDNQTITKPKPNVNVNVNDNDNENVSTSVDVWSLSESVLGYLNEKAGTNYKTDAATSVRLISDLSHKGYTESDMIAVIDKKVSAWLGDAKVEQYLRPSTLFGPKFEQYLSEPDTVGREARQKEKERKERRDKARSDLERYEREMSGLKGQYDATEDIRERIEIKGSIAVLEAKMEAARSVIGSNG